MKKILITISIVFLICCSSYKIKDTEQKKISKVTKIDFLDDGIPIVYIKTDSVEGIIIEDNKMLDLENTTKIEVGKEYSFSLIRIDKNYRGSTTYYALKSSKGTEKIIWNEKDGLPLVLYKANNLKGLRVSNFW